MCAISRTLSALAAPPRKGASRPYALSKGGHHVKIFHLPRSLSGRFPQTFPQNFPSPLQLAKRDRRYDPVLKDQHSDVKEPPQVVSAVQRGPMAMCARGKKNAAGKRPFRSGVPASASRIAMLWRCRRSSWAGSPARADF